MKMMKINKKVILILAIIILITTSLTVFAYDGHEHDEKCECEYTEITYKDITEEKAQPIVNFILGHEDPLPPTRFNLLCIFGHNIKNAAIILTEHNYYPTQPKCKESTTIVEYCIRDGCDYFKILDEYSMPILCHP